MTDKEKETEVRRGRRGGEERKGREGEGRRRVKMCKWD